VYKVLGPHLLISSSFALANINLLFLSVLLGEVMKERKSRFILASAKELLIRRCGPKTLYTACPKMDLQ